MKPKTYFVDNPALKGVIRYRTPGYIAPRYNSNMPRYFIPSSRLK